MRGDVESYIPAVRLSELEERVFERVQALEGRGAVYLRHLGRGDEVAIDADRAFPTGCMIKIPILLTVLQRVVDGTLPWDSVFTMTPDRVYGLGQLVDRLQIGSPMELGELLHHMVSLSDTAAGLWCQDIAGGGTAVNRWLADAGYAVTRVNSRTPGREHEFERYGWGQMSPREACGLLVSIRERRAVDPAADAYADRLLASTNFFRESLGTLPTDVHVISKTGAYEGVCGDVLLIAAPGGTFTCAVMTDELADTRPSADNAGWLLVRDVAALAWSAWGDGSPGSELQAWPPGRLASRP